jgi:hypothetical protein
MRPLLLHGHLAGLTSFSNIVAGHFSGIQNTGTGNIGSDTTVESCDSLIMVHSTHQGRQGNRFPLVGLC